MILDNYRRKGPSIFFSVFKICEFRLITLRGLWLVLDRVPKTEPSQLMRIRGYTSDGAQKYIYFSPHASASHSLLLHHRYLIIFWFIYCFYWVYLSNSCFEWEKKICGTTSAVIITPDTCSVCFIYYFSKDVFFC